MTTAAQSIDVQAVTGDFELADWEHVAIDGYPLPELGGAPIGAFAPPALLDDDRMHFFLGRESSHPVAAGASFVSHGIASLAFGTTIPAARRRGFWHHLAIQRLRATPALWTTGLFSDLGRPGAELLGFVPVLRLTLWILDRS